MYDAIPWWQQLVGSVFGILALGGIVGLFAAARRGRRGDDDGATSLARIAAASLVIGLVGVAVFRHYTQP
jgi:hypothetical protein